jgi:transcriptional regulator with XRE-family HTH domain
MKCARINPVPERQRGGSQSRYLSDLMSFEGLSARELARRSTVIAQEHGEPKLAVGHQAVSAWTNGTRHPNLTHRRVLAAILGVSIANLNRAFDPRDEHVNVRTMVKSTTAVIHGALQKYGHPVVVRSDISLSEPAVYRDWGEMFMFRPPQLMRHLRNVRHDLFGWIPDDSASPMVRSPHCLVPLERVSQRAALQALDTIDSAQRRIWFVYLPGGTLHVGVGHREDRLFSLARNTRQGLDIRTFPLSQVDFVGYFTGRVLFHLVVPAVNRQPRKHRDISIHKPTRASLCSGPAANGFSLAESSH